MQQPVRQLVSAMVVAAILASTMGGPLARHRGLKPALLAGLGADLLAIALLGSNQLAVGNLVPADEVEANVFMMTPATWYAYCAFCTPPDNGHHRVGQVFFSSIERTNPPAMFNR
jgi:hypothetical protein